MNRKFIISTGAFLLVGMLVTGYVAIATNGYGTEEDPLVTVSYINNVLKEQAVTEAGKIADNLSTEYSSELESQMTNFANELDSKIAQFETSITKLANDPEFIDKVADAVVERGGTISEAPLSWQVITLTNGQTLKAEVGTEVLLRIGTADCYAPSGTGIINLSSGSELKGGSELDKNNLYIITIKDKGITATSEATILVNGNYTLS